MVWGTTVVLFPNLAFSAFEMDSPRYPQIWQCVGMIVGVYGVGYLIAAHNPYQHWPIVLVGLLGKVLGPVGFLMSALQGQLPWSWGLIIIFNDLIWWVPFAKILYDVARNNSDTSIGRQHELADAISFFPSQFGNTLLELSHDGPVMVLLLRHFGCTFCRETLADLGRCKEKIESLGFKIAIVHMSPEDDAEEVLTQYGLADQDRYSDPHCEIYRALGVKRGSLSEVFGPKLWPRAFSAITRGHWIGKTAGDPFRLPGLFFLSQGEVWGAYRHQNAANRPDYFGLSQQVHRLLQGN